MTNAVWNNSEQQVAANSGITREMVTALPNGGYVVSWRQGESNGGGTIFFKIYNGLGMQVGGVHSLPNAGQSQNIADIQAIGTEGSFAISWNESNPGQSNSFSIRSRVYDVSGNITSGTNPVIHEGGLALDVGDTPSMARNGDSGFVTAYETGGKVFLAVQDDKGVVQSRLEIASATNVNQVDVTEIGAGKFVVSYTDGGNSPTVRYKVITLGSPVPDASISAGAGNDADVVALKFPDGSLTGDFAVTVQNGINVRTTFYSSTGALGETVSITTQGLAEFDYVHTTALRGGRVAVVSSQFTTENGERTDNGDIFLTIVSPDGTKTTYPTPLNSRAALDRFGQQYTPTVSEMTDGRIVVAWQDPSNNSITKVIFDPRVSAVNVIKGTEGRDHFVGTEYDNDELEAQGGADYLDGGAGFDYASYRSSGELVIASLANPGGNTNDAAGDTYVNIEGLIGSAWHDILIGNGSANRLWGLDGRDTIDGGAGNDSLLGGRGDDRLYGGAGADSLNGGEDGAGEGNHDIASYENAARGIVLNLSDRREDQGDAVGDVFVDIQAYVGSAFNDRMVGTDGYDEFFGGLGGDKLEGRGDNDYLAGQDGDDTLEGGAGADALDGGTGFNFASYALAKAGVVADLSKAVQDDPNGSEALGDRYTSIQGLIGSSLADTLIGNDLANVLRGGGEADTLSARNGSDTLDGGAGSDLLYGGEGLDYASYASAGAGVTADLNNLAGAEFAPRAFAGIVGTGDAAGDGYNSIEGLIGSAFNDVLIGDAGNNQLRGGAGSDVLIGGAGADALSGDDGIDTVDYSGAGNSVTVNLAAGRGAGSIAEGDTYASIENVIGSQFADVLHGNGAANVLQGGNGDDVYHVSAGDVVIEGASAGNDKVVADVNYTLGANVEALEGTGGGALVLTGNTLNNTIIGNGAGNWIDGGVGADTMMGGAGDDIYVVDNVGDVVEDYLGNNSIVTTVQLNLSNVRGNFASITAAEGFTFNVEGTSGNNVLKGNAVANTLKGNGGNDTIYGMLGNDKLYGGTGRDTFVFDTRLNKTQNVDKIYDFKSRDDSFHLDNAIFTKLGSGTAARPKMFKSDMFVEGTRAKDREDRIVYDKKSGNLYYDKDGTGGSAQVKIATLTNKTDLKYNDFFVI
ncbi:calcium-binding protein [Microvirga sp. CF3062]|uniref:calcium-binding protein n=1 Tax=Microvirga sp. CF3062 TaxID=3110182 RepID=UPI002E7A7BDF|nr:calcium-binding protein [Microvirga sp. CF3062]MEE1656007.1 calcium-binding protein [Microvirga sp. CF3062]